MWLLPVFSTVSRLLAGFYYRIGYAGGDVPARGPVLLVANHPNSLFDPVLVVAAARRPVRFLAKAPLFTDPKVGWLVRASGAIPVYRRKDDPSQLARNEEMFSAVREALSDDDAVALFPEGISHSGPALAPLKTGAARIALGFTHEHRASLPIVPVGLVLREKDAFRSDAQVLVGEPVAWQDLEGCPEDDVEAVRELTGRIDAALRRVTVNLDAWEDRPVVECALDVWEVGRGSAPDAAARVARADLTTRLLRQAREGTWPEGEELLRAVERHRRRLDRLGLDPRDLGRDTSTASALRWTSRRLLWASPPALALGAAAWLLFRIPYRLTGWVADRLKPDLDQRSTYKLLAGIPAYGLWTGLLALAAGTAFGIPWGLIVLVGLPVLGLTGLIVYERWRGAWDDARAYLFLRSRRRLIGEMARRQQTLADALHALVRVAGGPDEVTRSRPPGGTG